MWTGNKTSKSQIPSSRKIPKSKLSQSSNDISLEFGCWNLEFRKTPPLPCVAVPLNFFGDLRLARWRSTSSKGMSAATAALVP